MIANLESLSSVLPLPTDLTAAEQRLVEKAKVGEEVPYGSTRYRRGDEDDPVNGADWGTERTIRAAVICALAVGENGRVHPRGIRVVGAKISGRLDLEAATIPHPIILSACHIAEPITLTDADAFSISFQGSHTTEVNAAGLRTRGNLDLAHGFSATGEVSLLGARIGGDLNCSAGTFDNGDEDEKKDKKRHYAINGDRLQVDGCVFLNDGFLSKGEVTLRGAKIGSQLACAEGSFENKNSKRWALNAESMSVGGTFFFPSQIVGNVDLGYARVGELVDDPKSWPPQGKLTLNGFVYGRLAGDAPWQAGKWIDNYGLIHNGRLHWLDLWRPAGRKVFVQVGAVQGWVYVPPGKVLKTLGDWDDSVLWAPEFQPQPYESADTRVERDGP